MCMHLPPYAQHIRTLRITQGLTQDHVAKQIGISRVSYVALEKGTRALMFAEAVGLARLYGISIETFATTVGHDVEKYKEMILMILRTAHSMKVTIKKTKLAQLLYLIDMRHYYQTSQSLSGMTYRRFSFGPAAEIYLQLIEEPELNGTIVITQVSRDDYHMYEISESRGSAARPIKRLTNKEQKSITEVVSAWAPVSTAELTNFTSNQLPYRETAPGQVIAYNLILQEERHNVI